MGHPTQAPLLLATRSAGKLAELRPLFESRGVPVMDLDDLGLPPDGDEESIEQFDTFEDNALAKARYFFEASGGIATVAEDSGLEILGLGGAPGVRSKRWSQDESGTGKPSADSAGIDAANNATLVRAVNGLADRRARYVCAAAYVGLGIELARRGEVEGTMLTDPRGTRGFGYDPYFLSTELGQTFGEATRVDKERVSHRGRAFRSLLDAIKSK
jgi:XTP/dITP diphosphohydrolase